MKRKKQQSKKKELVQVDASVTPETQVELTAEEKEKLEAAKAAKAARMYFNANTQNAIVAYQNATTKKEKNALYTTEIMPAFEKLVENLINIHKFTSLHDTFDDLKNDCVNFLFETIYKFDATRGTNAFSYFNVVAKRWLIIKIKEKTKRVKRSVSLDDPESLSANEYKMIDEQCVVQSQDEVMMNEISSKYVIDMLHDIRRTKVKTENELTCINAIITIFENIDNIDLLNKSAILLYMRELSGLTPKQLTTTMQAVKKHYRKLKSDSNSKLF